MLHKIPLHGTVTSIEGIYTGPLLVYALSIGYWLWNGHPYGSLFMEELLNLSILAGVVIVLSKKLNYKVGFTAGLFLLTFWRFFESSLWDFNPFPTLSLALLLLYLLTEFVSGKTRYYWYALIPVLLLFNTDLASAGALFLLYVVVGIWGVAWKKILSPRYFLYSLIPLGLAAGFVLVQFAKQLAQIKAQSSGLGIFSGLNIIPMLREFGHIVQQIVYPHNSLIAAVIIAVLLYLFKKSDKSVNVFVKNILFVSFLMFTTSFLFFASNKGWRDWHTFYLYPVILLSLLLMISSLRKTIAVPIFILLFSIQTASFYDRLVVYPHPKDDPGILSNQMKVLDWIYQHAEENGFNIYTYTSTFYDHQYQYLFSWYGGKTYGYLPCEYSNFPLSHKYLYIPNEAAYTKPTLGCDKLRFLIVESETNGQTNANWIHEFREQTTLLESIEIGKIRIEKRSVLPR